MLRGAKKPALGHTANKEQSIDSNPGSRSELRDGIKLTQPIGMSEAGSGDSLAWSSGVV